MEHITLLQFVDKWFKSLNNEAKAHIAGHYQDETGDNTDLENGLNSDAVRWLEENYPNDITDFVCRKAILGDELLSALKEITTMAVNSTHAFHPATIRAKMALKQ